MANEKFEQRDKRARRVRSRTHGTSERPRLSVFRSSKHIYAQVIDDDAGKTLAAVSSLAETVAKETAESTKTETAKKVGAAIAKLCLEKNIKKVVFDRGGYLYHGRVSALADAARQAGLEF